MMELWACGFNAWNQLQFDQDGDMHGQPEDFDSFRPVLKADNIEIIHTSVSSTVVRTTDALGHSELKVAGFPNDFTDHLLQIHKSAEIDNANPVIAGNDNVAEFTKAHITQYTNLHQYLNRADAPFIVSSNIPNIIQLVSNQTTFTALSSSGSVYSFGDARFPASFGREITSSHPASLPAPIACLSDLPTGPIKKISSGGYVTGALTEGNDLYVWGGRPGEDNILEDIGGEPVPVDVEGNDILDFGIGTNHLIVLTTDGKLFVVGSGENGQLGRDQTERLTDWREIELTPVGNRKIVQVQAGYKSSYILVENT